jgi:NAD(P)-dependent dehydrogenase (short-subunit alcohol dehydrogenase family)
MKNGKNELLCLIKKVWLITGTSRGMGVDFGKAALAAGNMVVATGCNTEAVASAVGQADDLLIVMLGVTSRADSEAAVQAAVDRFGRSRSGQFEEVESNDAAPSPPGEE